MCRWALLLIGFILPNIAFAQANSANPEGEKTDLTRTVHVYGGRFLPFGIYGVRDIYPTWGGRYSQIMWGIQPELSAMFINHDGVEFWNGGLSLAFPEKFDGFTYFTFFGVDANYYHGRTNRRELDFKLTGGFHVGLRPTIDITDQLSLRVDFKFGFGPGQYLHIDGGLAFSF